MYYAAGNDASSKLPLTRSHSCDEPKECCEKLERDIVKLQKKVAQCCASSDACCKTVTSKIDRLQASLTRCCADQASCCTDIKNKLQEIENMLAACCMGGGIGSCATFFITEIPAGGLILDKPGHYIVCNPLFFDGSSGGVFDQAVSRSKNIFAAEPFSNTTFGVIITSTGVEFDLNNQPFTINGENIGAVFIAAGASSSVTGGSIVGNNAAGQFGVAIAATASAAANAAAAITVSNVAFANIAAAAAPAAAVAPAAAAAAAAAPAAAAVAVAAAAAAAAAPLQLLRSPLSFDPPLDKLSGVRLENLRSDNNLNGLSIQGNVTNVIVRDFTINRSIEMGITQPSRSGFHGNFLFENVAIANSGLNGIYITFNQDNWIFNNLQIRNSGLNGAIFEGTQNLTVTNAQISQSGAKGLVASIRQSQNITLTGLEIINSGDEAIRVDNVQQLSISNSKCINYTPTTHPVCKIQDVNNGTITGNQFMSAAGLADGLFIRNSRGLILDSNLVKVFNNVTSSTPTAQPPITSGSNNGITTFIEQQFGCTSCISCPPTPPANLCTGSRPVGINLQGGVTGCKISNCVISGTPAVGIAVQSDLLNGYDEGVVIERCLIDGAECAGIIFSQAVNSAVLSTQVVNCQGDGISIDSLSTRTAVRDTTLTNNRGVGLRNLGLQSQIYHNFASGNGQNYVGVPLVAAPAAGLGSLENISS